MTLGQRESLFCAVLPRGVHVSLEHDSPSRGRVEFREKFFFGWPLSLFVVDGVVEAVY